MNADQKRRLDMLGRVAGFGKRHLEDIAAGSKLAELLGLVTQAESEATGGGAEQVSGLGHSRAGAATKADLYEDLLAELRDIRDTSRTVAKTVPGVAEKFRLPRSISQINILTTARAFLKDAAPLEAEFIACEMAADFLTNLENDIKAYDKAEDDQGDGQGKHTSATRTIAEAINDGCDAVRDADPLVKNRYKHDGAKQADWFTASHVERAARKKTVAVPAV